MIAITKPYFSISDDGEWDFDNLHGGKATANNSMIGVNAQYVIRRAPLVAETLKYAFANAGLLSPTSNIFKQSKGLNEMAYWVWDEFAPGLVNLDSNYGVGDADTSTKSAVASATGLKTPPNYKIGARTDFIYTEHDENTTVTSFDAFVFMAKLEEFANRHFIPLQDRFFYGSGEVGEMAPPAKPAFFGKMQAILENPKHSYGYSEPLHNYVEILAYSIERYRVDYAAGPDNKSFKFEHGIYISSLDGQR